MHVLDHMTEKSNSLKEIGSALTTRNENELNNCNNLPFNTLWIVKIHKSPCELWGRFCSSNPPPRTLIKLTTSDSQNKNKSLINIFHSSIGCNLTLVLHLLAEFTGVRYLQCALTRSNLCCTVCVQT